MVTEFHHSQWRKRLLQVASDISKFTYFSAEITMQGSTYCRDGHVEQFAGLSVSKQIDGKTFDFLLTLRCPLCNYSLLSLDLQFPNWELPRLSDQSLLPSAELIQLIFHAVRAPQAGEDRDGEITRSMLSADNVVNSINRILH